MYVPKTFSTFLKENSFFIFIRENLLNITYNHKHIQARGHGDWWVVVYHLLSGLFARQCVGILVAYKTICRHGVSQNQKWIMLYKTICKHNLSQNDIQNHVSIVLARMTYKTLYHYQHSFSQNDIQNIISLSA